MHDEESTTGASQKSKTPKKKKSSNTPPSWNLKDPDFWTWFFKEWVLTVGLAFAVALLFRSTIASPRHIPTGSMIPTIKVGEFIFVNMMKYNWHLPFTKTILSERAQPERGDIVVFEFPNDPDKDYIKRVVGLPGDIIEIRQKKVIVNGTPLELVPVEDRQILDDLTPKYDPAKLTLYTEKNGKHEYLVIHSSKEVAQNFGPVTVPPNEYFVMGDNRDDSYDSRFWGSLPREKIFGTGSFIWLSINFDHPPWIRFSRLFTTLD